MKTRSPKSDHDSDQRQLAVLIDADNAQPAVIAGLLAEVAKYGVASVKRIYGDFTSQRLQGWKSALLDHSIQPMQQFAYTSGKNATDSSLIIDAMDLMYTRRFDGMCLVSSDSDFTRLAQRLREEGLKVYGFGERKTPDAFVQACDKFVYVEVLRQQKPAAKAGGAAARVPTGAPAAGMPATAPVANATHTANAAPSATGKAATARPGKPPAKAAAKNAGARSGKGAQPQTGGPAKTAAVGDLASAPRPASLTEVTAVDAPAPEPSAPLPVPRELIAQAIEDSSDDQGWARLSGVGDYLNKLRPDFDPRLYGHRKLSDLIRKNPQWFELQERGETAAKTVFVRVKT